MKKLVTGLLGLLLLMNSEIKAQLSMNAAEIAAGLNKLNTLGSVLYIAAHPDDENTRLLSYLAKERNLRAGYLSITRGDGGQNLVGKEQGEALGLIRTQELLAARRVDGAEQFFTHANDFGYSKNPEETFGFWNRDSILADVVWIIRNFKPDVIICRFPTTGEGGHGHHTASALLAVEAFSAAADPRKFPEQLKLTQVWKAKRILWNTFNFGGTNTTAPNQMQVDVGVYNSLLGKGYGEIAAESRSNHKSQGFGSAKSRGSQIEYFKHLAGDSAKAELFEGIQQQWTRIPNAEKIKSEIESCLKNYDASHPDRSANALIAIYKMIQQLDEKNADVAYWKRLKLKETENLLVACLGLWCEAFASDYSVVPGGNFEFTAQMVNRSSIPVKLNKLMFASGSDTLTAITARQNELLTLKHRETFSNNAAYSNPYWLNEKHEIGRYQVNKQSLIGRPENEASYTVGFNVDINGFSLTLNRPVAYKSTDPVKGEIYRSLEVLPQASINLSEKCLVFSDNSAKNIQITIHANVPNLKGKLEIKVPKGYSIKTDRDEIELKNKGEEISINASITPTGNLEEGKLEITLKVNDLALNKSIRRIEYDHIPYQFILSNCEAKLVPVKLKKIGNRIAYIPGAGDEVAECLKQIGYDVTLLNDDLLGTADLSQYSAIVTGVRAYNTNDKLQYFYSRLMDYVQNGGNLIVQYNTNNRIGPLLAKIGPYPFTISRDRVTDEQAEVRFINPNHPALTLPNKIDVNDFKGWIQERGIYFASELDKNYESILSMNDPGEKSNEGSLIIGKYGKGNFIYTGLVFFRELPAGVPGAYRLMSNLISLPKNSQEK